MSETDQQFQLPLPVAEHRQLQPFVGTFKAVVKFFADPSQEPHVTTGTMTNQWKIEGLFLHQDYIGDHVEHPYPKFVGQGFWGYNTSESRYEGFWIDSSSTGMQFESGQFDPAQQTWELHAQSIDPQTQQPLNRRTLIKLIDSDHHSMETFRQGPEGEVKTMEIQYTRSG